MKENLKYGALILAAVLLALVVYDASGLRAMLAPAPTKSAPDSAKGGTKAS